MASVAIDAKNRALLVLGAWTILNLLLNTSSEKTLENEIIKYQNYETCFKILFVKLNELFIK